MRTRIAGAFSIALVALFAALAYWPGLSGGFLFDDLVNLNALGRYGGVRDWETLLYYLTSGTADPTGRPVAMASFLVDANNWPAEPWPFKRTNLVLHLLNGILLYGVLVELGRRLNGDMGWVRLAALFGAGLWLLHPLWVSTVLYVIQRQAMLAAFFVLAGVRAWIGSHDAFVAGRSRQGWCLAILAVPVFGLLAGLSKANGFLLPLLLVTLQFTVLAAGRQAGREDGLRRGRTARICLLYIPALLIIMWLAWSGIQAMHATESVRPWTVGERLLSQPRALCHYLWQLLVPGLSAMGVFADGFSVSADWRTPWTTLPAVIVVAGLVVLAVWVRRALPVLAAALLFFLAGHLLESTVIMLELYFEHRNYLPAALLFWPLAWWLTAPGPHRRFRLAGLAGFALLTLATLNLQARLWADPLALAVTWAQQSPQSARATTYAALQERATGRVDAAEARLLAAMRRSPTEPQYAINLLDIRCQLGRVRAHDVRSAAEAIVASKGLVLDLTYQWLSRTLLPGSKDACAGLPEPVLTSLVESSLTGAATMLDGNPEMSSRKHRLLAHLALHRGDCQGALQAFDQRLEIQPRPEFVTTQVGLLATQCGSAAAQEHLRRYVDAGAPVFRASSPMLRLRDWLTARNGFWSTEWRRLDAMLTEDRHN